ncbi:MAG: ATP-binding protein, partial [Humibacter sp.]
VAETQTLAMSPSSNPPITARLRVGGGRSLPAALVVVAVFAVLLGFVEIAFGTQSPGLLWVVISFTVVFWIWVGAGLLAWWRRRHNATGLLIVVGGLAIFLAGLANLGIPALTLVSAIFATTPLAVTVQLLHAFPSGRLRGRLSIVTVILIWVACPVAQFVLIVIPSDQPAVFQVIVTSQRILGIAVMVLTAIVLTQRLIAADARHRRIFLPLFGYGIFAVLVLGFAGTIARAFGFSPSVVGLVQLAVSALIPIAFLLGVLLGGFSRTGDLEPLSAWLAISGAGKPAVAKALASTLGDDSLRVVYWSEEREEFLDELGSPVSPEQRGNHRGWSEVRVESRLVGAIDYDTVMTADPEPVRRAGDVLAIAVDRERLTAELLATNEALVQSRIRLIETADRERSRIAQDLHDGIQVQLVLLALAAQTIANSDDASPATSEASAQLRRGIDETAADLRRLVHNVLPAALAERGLTAAAEDLVDRLAIPATLDADVDDDAISSTTVHTAYFIIAEALTNATKHSRATSVRVKLRSDGEWLHIDVRDNGIGGASVNRGAGLRSLADRVDALGGKLDVQSAVGHGTRVKVELPCG